MREPAAAAAATANGAISTAAPLAEAATEKASRANEEAIIQRQKAIATTPLATQLQQDAADEALKHKLDAKEKSDIADAKAKAAEEAANVALAGSKFDAEALVAIEAVLAASVSTLMPTVPVLAVDATQALHTPASPPRRTITSLVRGTWLPGRVPGCLGGDANTAGQARITRTRSLVPAGPRRRRKVDSKDENK